MADVTQGDLLKMLKQAMGGGMDTDSRPGANTMFGASDYDQKAALSNPDGSAVGASGNQSAQMQSTMQGNQQTSNSSVISPPPPGVSAPDGNGGYLVQYGKPGAAGGSGQQAPAVAQVQSHYMDRMEGAGNAIAEAGSKGTRTDNQLVASLRPAPSDARVALSSGTAQPIDYSGQNSLLNTAADPDPDPGYGEAAMGSAQGQQIAGALTDMASKISAIYSKGNPVNIGPTPALPATPVYKPPQLAPIST